MKDWIKSNGKEVQERELIECEIQHCNPSLNIPNKIIRGMFCSDGFYFEDGGELTFNWNIIRWRRL